MVGWRFLRDMLVLDWLFGLHKTESNGERSLLESGHYTDYSSYDNDYTCSDYGGYGGGDYAQQDFDDDLDSGMFDDDF